MQMGEISVCLTVVAAAAVALAVLIHAHHTSVARIRLDHVWHEEKSFWMRDYFKLNCIRDQIMNIIEV